MTANRGSALADSLGRLEQAYGHIVDAADPAEGGVLALLAIHAPSLSTEQTRDRIRESFVDWNEARVADPWDVVEAVGAAGSAEARAFARAAIRFLESLHGVLNRCSFEPVPGEPPLDFEAVLAKVRGAPPAVRAVCLALLTPAPAWHATPEIVKAALKLELVPKTTSAQKVATGLAEICPPEARLRGHYLLARYGARAKEDADPLAAESGKKKPAKSAKTAKPAKAAKPKGAKA